MAETDPIDICSTALRVRILPQGAALVGVRFADDARNLVLGFADPADHASCPVFAGPLVGPVANRVRGGRVPIDGT
ncbi:MAG: galactose mutarotase, partial [Sulfitobacter sp.]